MCEQHNKLVFLCNHQALIKMKWSIPDSASNVSLLQIFWNNAVAAAGGVAAAADGAADGDGNEDVFSQSQLIENKILSRLNF